MQALTSIKISQIISLSELYSYMDIQKAFEQIQAGCTVRVQRLSNDYINALCSPPKLRRMNENSFGNLDDIETEYETDEDEQVFENKITNNVQKLESNINTYCDSGTSESENDNTEPELKLKPESKQKLRCIPKSETSVIIYNQKSKLVKQGNTQLSDHKNTSMINDPVNIQNSKDENFTNNKLDTNKSEPKIESVCSLKPDMPQYSQLTEFEKPDVQNTKNIVKCNVISNNSKSKKHITNGKLCNMTCKLKMLKSSFKSNIAKAKTSGIYRSHIHSFQPKIPMHRPKMLTSVKSKIINNENSKLISDKLDTKKIKSSDNINYNNKDKNKILKNNTNLLPKEKNNINNDTSVIAFDTSNIIVENTNHFDVQSINNSYIDYSNNKKCDILNDKTFKEPDNMSEKQSNIKNDKINNNFNLNTDNNNNKNVENLNEVKLKSESNFLEIDFVKKIKKLDISKILTTEEVNKTATGDSNNNITLIEPIQFTISFTDDNRMHWSTNNKINYVKNSKMEIDENANINESCLQKLLSNPALNVCRNNTIQNQNKSSEKFQHEQEINIQTKLIKQCETISNQDEFSNTSNTQINKSNNESKVGKISIRSKKDLYIDPNTSIDYCYLQIKKEKVEENVDQNKVEEIFNYINQCSISTMNLFRNDLKNDRLQLSSDCMIFQSCFLELVKLWGENNKNMLIKILIMKILKKLHETNSFKKCNLDGMKNLFYFLLFKSNVTYSDIFPKDIFKNTWLEVEKVKKKEDLDLYFKNYEVRIENIVRTYIKKSINNTSTSNIETNNCNDQSNIIVQHQYNQANDSLQKLNNLTEIIVTAANNDNQSTINKSKSRSTVSTKSQQYNANSNKNTATQPYTEQQHNISNIQSKIQKNHQIEKLAISSHLNQQNNSHAKKLCNSTPVKSNFNKYQSLNKDANSNIINSPIEKLSHYKSDSRHLICENPFSESESIITNSNNFSSIKNILYQSKNSYIHKNNVSYQQTQPQQYSYLQSQPQPQSHPPLYSQFQSQHLSQFQSKFYSQPKQINETVATNQLNFQNHINQSNQQISNINQSVIAGSETIPNHSINNLYTKNNNTQLNTMMQSQNKLSSSYSSRIQHQKNSNFNIANKCQYPLQSQHLVENSNEKEQYNVQASSNNINNKFHQSVHQIPSHPVQNIEYSFLNNQHDMQKSLLNNVECRYNQPLYKTPYQRSVHSSINNQNGQMITNNMYEIDKNVVSNINNQPNIASQFIQNNKKVSSPFYNQSVSSNNLNDFRENNSIQSQDISDVLEQYLRCDNVSSQYNLPNNSINQLQSNLFVNNQVTCQLPSTMMSISHSNQQSNINYNNQYLETQQLPYSNHTSMNFIPHTINNHFNSFPSNNNSKISYNGNNNNVINNITIQQTGLGSNNSTSNTFNNCQSYMPNNSYNSRNQFSNYICNKNYNNYQEQHPKNITNSFSMPVNFSNNSANVEVCANNKNQLTASSNMLPLQEPDMRYEKKDSNYDINCDLDELLDIVPMDCFNSSITSDKEVEMPISVNLIHSTYSPSSNSSVTPALYDNNLEFRSDQPISVPIVQSSSSPGCNDSNSVELGEAMNSVRKAGDIYINNKSMDKENYEFSDKTNQMINEFSRVVQHSIDK